MAARRRLVRLEATALFDALARLKLDTLAAPDRINRVALVFSLVAGTAALPHLVMRGFTARSVEEARNSFLFAVPLAGVVFIAAPAYSALLGGEDIVTGDALSAVLTGLIATAAIAACLALGSGLLLAMANGLSYDLYYKSWHLTAPDRAAAARRSRRDLLVVAALAAIAALSRGRHHARFSPARPSRLRQARCLPALLLGVWWKRANGEGALAGMIAGLVVCLYYMVAPRYFPYAFYETSSAFSNATEAQAAAYRSLRQTYYLADPQTRPAAARCCGRSRCGRSPIGGGSAALSPACSACRSALVVTIAVSLFTTGAVRGRAELRRGSAQGATRLAARALLRRGIAADCDRSPRLIAEQAEGVAEALGIVFRGVALGTRRHQHVDAVAGRHDIDEVIELALAAVAVCDGLEAGATGDRRRAPLAQTASRCPWRRR